MNKFKAIITVVSLIIIAPFVSIVGFLKFITVDLFSYIKNIKTSISVLREGKSAVGEIISLYQTNAWDGNRPICELHIKFIDNQNTERMAITKTAIKIVDIQNYQKGNFVDIKFNPKNPTEIAVDDKSLTF